VLIFTAFTVYTVTVLQSVRACNIDDKYNYKLEVWKRQRTGSSLFFSTGKHYQNKKDKTQAYMSYRYSGKDKLRLGNSLSPNKGHLKYKT